VEKDTEFNDYRAASHQVARNLKWLRWIKYKQDKPLLHSDKLYRRLIHSLASFYLEKQEQWKKGIIEENCALVKERLARGIRDIAKEFKT